MTEHPEPFTALVITSSDRCAAGEVEDHSGPAVQQLLDQSGFEADLIVLPDEREQLANAMRRAARDDVALVAITGGTGFGPRDVTPEATRDVIERDAPGLSEAMRAGGRTGNLYADLSRGVCGIVGRTLILNLPGSPRGATESLGTILDILPHALRLLRDEGGHH